jgi:glutaredoxin
MRSLLSSVAAPNHPVQALPKFWWRPPARRHQARRQLTRRGRSLAIVLLSLCFAASLVGCKERKQHDQVEPSAATDLPGIAFTVDSKVLYTWVKDDGSFQLAEKLEAIPAAAREQVRVVVEDQPPGSPIHVFVADLRAAQPGAPAKATPLERQAWEARGLAFRKAKVEPLEKQAQADAPPPPMATGKTAIVYGADWCGPCHQAEDYLKKRGMAVTKKDIEEDPSAVTEMRAKLRAAGLGISSSIPILDVAGTMLIGFSPRAIDAAIRSGK